jgi:hypothetical protein
MCFVLKPFHPCLTLSLLLPLLLHNCRRLQNAASEGNIDGAESAITGMEAAGLAAGPRAFHVLLCAYLKGGDTPGALAVTGRATEAGAA